MNWFIEKKLISLWNGRDLCRQVETAMHWIGTVATERDIILLDLPRYRRAFYFKFPLKRGDNPKSKRTDGEPTFVIKKTATPNANFAKSAGDWKCIFSSPEIEIWERTSRAVSLKPLRWGLSAEEKALALRVARRTLAQYFIDEKFQIKPLPDLPARFYLKTDLDVALWTNGELRGSYVTENFHLWEGIQKAAIGAIKDMRFKPLTAEELKDTRIEITLLSALRIPFSINSKQVLPEKGYIIIADEKQGIYLPEVINVRRFLTVKQFLEDLAEEKAGLNRKSLQHAKLHIFEVDDFIESSDRKTALSLWGPVLASRDDINNQEFFIQLQKMAADWLCRIQETSGNMPPIINPLTGRQKQVDWVRLAFTAYALAEFGAAVKEKNYINASKKAFRYLKANLFPKPKIQFYELTLSYFGKLSLALGKHDEANMAVHEICRLLPSAVFEPIAFAQAGSFLKEVSKSQRQFSTFFENTAKILKDNFERTLNSGGEMNLAVWAETASVFFEFDPEFCTKVFKWLIDQQLPGGAFPESTSSNFVYARGTGKIAEILALDPKNNESAVTKALQWLVSMKYDDDNTYFIPAGIRSKVIGGFRHDYLNHEAWIDSAGHFLLVGARLLANKPKL